MKKNIIETKTPYSEAWHKFIQTKDHLLCIEAMIMQGIIYPYNENILKVAFDAGWNYRNEYLQTIIK